MDTEKARKIIDSDWKVSPYYEIAERYRYFFWDEGSPFAVQFSKLDPSMVVELACGHGRHTADILDRFPHSRVTLVDVNVENIEACRERFGSDPRLSYIVNNGRDLANIEDGSHTAVFCYDAMVHFELEDVISYLSEIYRVLKPGGRALLHYSNYDRAPGGSYHDNPHWRNFCTERLFCHLCQRQGFGIIHSQTLDWGFGDGTVADLDGLTVIEKA